MYMKTPEGVLNFIRPELLLTVGILLLFFLINKWRKAKKLPPGPMGLPIVGFLPFLSEAPHLQFMKLAKKYGNVFSFYLGSEPVVVLNDVESIREAFAKDELLARPPNSPFTLLNIKTPFFTSDYRMWKEQRKFVVQSMKDLGLGKTKIEGHVTDEIQYFLSVLGKSKGEPVDVLTPLTPSMSNNICALVFGERYEYDSPDRVILDNGLKEVSNMLGQTNSFIFFPWILKIPFVKKFLKLENGLKAFEKIFKLFDDKIQKHKETLDPNNIRDFIDSYILETNDRLKKDPKTTFSEPTLKGCTGNLFGAGSETVRTTISWCLYVMAAYPEVQKQIQKEIDNVLGSRYPEFPDQKDMTYTQAVIREVMRWQSTVPLNIFRYALDDIHVSGHLIPKGSTVLANFWSVHHDPKYWKNPEEFQPKRFLSEDGTLLKNNAFMPFSVGKRSCPGETMAMMEVFLYFVSILQRFHVSFPKGYKPDFKGKLGVTYHVVPFKLCFTTR